MKVKCRKANAIGIFYWVDFPVHSKEEWFDQFGQEWELWCFEPFTQQYK